MEELFQQNDEEVKEEQGVWLGLEVHIPDKQAAHYPEDMQGFLRKKTHEYLEKSMTNIDFDETGEGMDVIPLYDDWDENPLLVRYKHESWFDDPESKVGRIRAFDIWFPVRDFMEHHELDVLKEKYTYIIGDEVYNKYGQEADIRGILIASTKESVRSVVTEMYNHGESMEDYIS